MHDARDESIGELLKDLTSETSTLVRQELAFARAELAQKGKAPARAPACSPPRASWRC